MSDVTRVTLLLTGNYSAKTMRTGNIFLVRKWVSLDEILFATYDQIDPITGLDSTFDRRRQTLPKVHFDSHSWRQNQKILSNFLWLFNSHLFQMVLVKDFRNGFYEVIQHQVKPVYFIGGYRDAISKLLTVVLS